LIKNPSKREKVIKELEKAYCYMDRNEYDELETVDLR